MKVVSPQIIHKWDCGGVILNIDSEEKARDAFISIMTNAREKGPSNAQIVGVEVQEMITRDDKKKTNELIFGINRDPTFGPMIMVGSGGIYANYVKDVAFDLAINFDKDDAQRLIEKTNIYSILQGVRGEPRSDIKGILEILETLGQLVNDFEDIVELDINPCLIFDEKNGYSAVDIKITINYE
jgi:acetyltransferase